MRLFKFPFVFILSLVLTNTLFAQDKSKDKKAPIIEIIVGENIQLNEAIDGQQLIEPHISSHPSDPDHLLAVGWVFPTSGEDTDLNIERCATFVSKDGGKNWIRNDLSGKECADPWVTLTEKGAVLTSLGSHNLLPDSENDQLLAFFSNDGGSTWSKVPQSLGYSHDGPRSTLGLDGTVYIASHQSTGNVSAAIYVAKNLAQGRVPFIEKTTRLFPSNLNLAIDGITTLSDGTIAIIYQDFQRPVSGSVKDKNGKFRGKIKTRREWVITSTDKGKTFSMPSLITEDCFDRANDLTVDKSNGTYKDRLYSVCSNKDYKSVLLMSSSDKGLTWTDALPLEVLKPQRGIRIEPMLAVNKDGVLAVAWFDTRGGKTPSYRERKCHAPYIAISLDGGETFSTPIRVSDKLGCFEPSKIGEFVERRWPEGGDYFGLTTTSDGRFHVLWPDARSGKFELMTATVTVKR